MHYANNTTEGIRATDTAEQYLAGNLTYVAALRELQLFCNMEIETAKDFLRNAVEAE